MSKKNQKEVIAFKTLDEFGIDRRGKKFEIGESYTTDPSDMFEGETFPVRLFSFHPMLRSTLVKCVLTGKVSKENGGTKYEATKLRVVEEVDITYAATASIGQLKVDSKMPVRVEYNDVRYEFIRLNSNSSLSKDLCSGYDGSLISTNSYCARVRVSGVETKVSSTGDESNIFVGGERNTISATGTRSIVVAWGSGHCISVSGYRSTICADGEDITISSSDDFANIIALGVCNKISTTGDETEIYSCGDRTFISAVGEGSIIKSTGKNCTIYAGSNSIVSAGLGSWITLTKTKEDDKGNIVPVEVVSWRVDGDCIMPGVYYKLSDDDFEPVKWSNSKKENIE